MGSKKNHSERPRWQWWLVFIGAPVAIVLGTVGFWFSSGSIPGLSAWLDAFYRALQLLLMRMSPVSKMHWTLEIARWLAALLFGLAAVLTFLRFFRDELRQIRLQIPWPRHVVILGFGPKTTQLIQCFRRQKRRVVVVAPANEAGCAELCRANGATLVTGELAEPETLAKARICRASHVVALSPDDSTNMAIAVASRKLILKKADCCKKPRAVKCFVHLSDVDTRASLQTSGAFGRDARCEIRFFDLFDAAVRELMMDPKQMPLDPGGVGEHDPRQVHLVILGFGRMGRTVALRAAQLGHFANRKPLRISVIDQQADRRKQALLFRYPDFAKTCEIEFHQLEMESLPARQLLETWCADRSKAVSIVSCFDRDALALEVALRMKARVQEFHVPMFVRMSSQAGFAGVLQGGSADSTSLVQPFGMIENCCSDEFLENKRNEDLAQAIHEDYRVERIADIQRKGEDPAKDISTRPWAELDDGLKDSNRQQADHIDIKLHALGMERIDNDDPRAAIERLEPGQIELLAEMEHSRWNAERWLQGWTLGPGDKPKKVTPYLVPWAELPEDIKKYDRNTVSKIPAFLKIINQKVCRKVV